MVEYLLSSSRYVCMSCATETSKENHQIRDYTIPRDEETAGLR